MTGVNYKYELKSNTIKYLGSFSLYAFKLSSS